MDTIMDTTGLAERSRRRRQVIEVHRSASFAEAEAWDLAYWQRRTPEERLSALVAIRRDVELAQQAKAGSERAGS